MYALRNVYVSVCGSTLVSCRVISPSESSSRNTDFLLFSMQGKRTASKPRTHPQVRHLMPPNQVGALAVQVQRVLHLPALKHVQPPPPLRPAGVLRLRPLRGRGCVRAHRKWKRGLSCVDRSYATPQPIRTPHIVYTHTPIHNPTTHQTTHLERHAFINVPRARVLGQRARQAKVSPVHHQGRLLPFLLFLGRLAPVAGVGKKGACQT